MLAHGVAGAGLRCLRRRHRRQAARNVQGGLSGCGGLRLTCSTPKSASIPPGPARRRQAGCQDRDFHLCRPRSSGRPRGAGAPGVGAVSRPALAGRGVEPDRRGALFDTHEILSLVWAQPVLTPAQIALAHWISDYYLAPLIESLLLMLPVGLSQRGRTVFARTAKPAPADLTPNQAALLARIAQKEGDWAAIRRGCAGSPSAPTWSR